MNSFVNYIRKNIELNIFILFSFFSLIVIFVDFNVRYSFIILSLFSFISISSLYGIFLSRDKAPYSLNKTYNIFIFLFFGIAPALQFKNEIIFFEAPLLNEGDYQTTALIIAIMQIFYLVGYNFFYRFSFFNKKYLTTKTTNNILLYYSLSVFALLLFLFLMKFNFDVIFKRPANHWQKVNTRFGLFGYSLLLIVRAIPLICLIIYELTFRNKKKKYTFFLLFIAFLTAFPFSLGRATIGYYYLPLVILYIPFFNNKLTYSLSFLGAILFVFPVLNFFRPRGSVDFAFKQFLTPHFDAFHNFSFLLKENFVSYGDQLLGAILFFIPKSKWEVKPIGTGQQIAENLNFNYTNISMPFFGEGYANFGYLGIIISVLFIACLNAFFDKNYWKNNFNVLFKVFFLFLLGFEFYLMRGDLYSSIKLSGSYLIALFIVMVSFYLYNKFQKSNKI